MANVDHIYSYPSLTTPEDKPIYYQGDSKYYKIGNSITKEVVYKQFTYARIGYNGILNLFLDKETPKEELEQVPKYRDDQTEGYNIVPNFFISAKMNEHLSYADNVTTQQRELITNLSLVTLKSAFLTEILACLSL